ncbi:hypothetical protein E2K93_11140 [Thalassotalea sp. HSM 43]|uniref:hypothetical protein n=1 Tax=Thalassotalea sp. HSM 43 TaxID=2552945 RepID=UPI00108047E7|nr:hypothetical protein [Thalassotalea sp. HSM 43]QBY04902.1 hypothetical protein E2K93_11140 [Thalassotalea sp. HSM 43]
MRAFFIFLSVVIFGMYALLHDPDLDDQLLVNEYQDNKHVFDAISELSCSIDFNGAFYASKASDIEKHVLKKHLRAVNVEYVFIKYDENFCNLALTRFVRGFAGKGYSYKFRYNLQSPNLFDEKVHDKNNWRVGLNEEGVFTYDVPLGNGWFLTYTQS